MHLISILKKSSRGMEFVSVPKDKALPSAPRVKFQEDASVLDVEDSDDASLEENVSLVSKRKRPDPSISSSETASESSLKARLRSGKSLPLTLKLNREGKASVSGPEFQKGVLPLYSSKADSSKKKKVVVIPDSAEHSADNIPLHGSSEIPPSHPVLDAHHAASSVPPPSGVRMGSFETPASGFASAPFISIPALTDVEKNQPFIPDWSFKRGDFLDSPAKVHEFVSKGIPDAERIRVRSMANPQLIDQYSSRLFRFFNDGAEVVQRLCWFEMSYLKMKKMNQALEDRVGQMAIEKSQFVNDRALLESSQSEISRLKAELEKISKEKSNLVAASIASGEEIARLHAESMRSPSSSSSSEVARLLNELQHADQRIKNLEDELSLEKESASVELAAQSLYARADLALMQEKIGRFDEVSLRLEESLMLVEDLRVKAEVLENDLSASKEEVVHLSTTHQANQKEMVQLAATNQKLVEDRSWLIAHGFSQVVSRIHRSSEYTRLVSDFSSACLAVGYQNGLVAGYGYSDEGIPVEDTPFYDPTVESWMSDAAHNLTNSNHSLIAQLSASPDISVSEIQNLVSVVDESQHLLPIHGLRDDVIRSSPLNVGPQQKPINDLFENKQFVMIDQTITKPALIDMQDYSTSFNFKFPMSGLIELEKDGLDLLTELQPMSTDYKPYFPDIVHMDSQLLFQSLELDSRKPLIDFVGDLVRRSEIIIHEDGQVSLTGNRTEMKEDILAILAEFYLSKNSTNWRKSLVPHFNRLDYDETSYYGSALELETVIVAPPKSPQKVKPKTSTKKKGSRQKTAIKHRSNYFQACESLLSIIVDKNRSGKFAIPMLKKSGPELPNLLTQFSASIAGTGIAVLFSVVYKVTSGRVPFCSSKVLNTGLGLGLVWLSWAVNGLRDTIVIISRNSNKKKGLKDEEMMKKLDISVKDIYFRAATLMAVMVLRLA